MPPPYDIFVSYTTPDRPWAERFYLDMKRAYPAVKVFWDRESLSPGLPYNVELARALKGSTHLFNLVSEAATRSNNVAAEIAEFQAEIARIPNVGDSTRRQFPLVLQGTPAVGQIVLQGFDDMKKCYLPSPVSPECGVSALAGEQAATEWNRIIRLTGEAVYAAKTSQEVTVAIITLNEAILPAVGDDTGDFYANDPMLFPLGDFLAKYGLTWPEVSQRYGTSGLDWKPFGGTKTILDLLEDLAVQTNANLRYTSDRFHWRFLDLSWSKGAKTQQLESVKGLQENMSMVILDPVALYERWANLVFRMLDPYTQDDRSIIVSLSPVAQNDPDWIARMLRERVSPMLDNYFDPHIPPPLGFAHCAMNVQRIPDMERLIRNRIGMEHRERKLAAKKIENGMVS